MATALGISQSQVSRMELGQQVAEPAVVDGWARAAGASDAERETLLGIAEAAAAEMVSWRKAMARGLARLQEDSRELEAAAAVILNFQTAGVPGLLQVPEYARRVFATERQATEADIAAAVAGRMNRQTILYGGSKRLEFVMTEAAVRWRLGACQPDAGAGREDHRRLRAGATSRSGSSPRTPRPTCGTTTGSTSSSGQANDEAVVHVETLTRGLTITDPADVAAYRDAFSRLRKLAVTGADAQAMLRQISLA